MKTVVITGCAGLLGNHFSRHLLKKGYRVIGFDDLSGGYEDYLPNHENFQFYKLNLSDEFSDFGLSLVMENSSNNIVACFHFAAYAAEGLSPFIRNYNYTNNIVTSANVINACINSDTKLIFTSSMAVYGNQEPPFTEDMLPRPIDPYGVAKYAVEMDLKIAGEQHGLRYNIVRPHNIIGIRQNIWDRYRNVAGIFIRRVLDGQPILVYGDGEQRRAFSDIRYYMEPFEKLIDGYDSETYNLGADLSCTINELAQVVSVVSKRFGHETKIEHVEPRHEVKHAYCDHSKAKHELGFKDKTNLPDLIEEMFLWSMSQPKRETKCMPYEVKKGIYEYWK